jgi:hypothetical protein
VPSVRRQRRWPDAATQRGSDRDAPRLYSRRPARQPWGVLLPLLLLVFFGGAVLYSAAGGTSSPGR